MKETISVAVETGTIWCVDPLHLFEMLAELKFLKPDAEWKEWVALIEVLSDIEPQKIFHQVNVGMDGEIDVTIDIPE